MDRMPLEDRLADARDLYMQGNFIEAIRRLGEIGIDAPAAAEAWLLYGDCCSQLGARKEALACYQAADTLAPGRREVTLRLVAHRTGRADLTAAEQAALLPGFSLPPEQNVAARTFLDIVAAPHLSSVYANDNIIVFQRALTFLHDARFMGSVGRASEGELTFSDRTWRAHILVWAAWNALKLGGDFVELGTFRAFFASCVVDCLDFGGQPQQLFLYDTFEGLPEDSVREEIPDSFYKDLQSHYSQPDIHASVCARFEGLSNVHVVRGKVPDSLRDTCPARIAWLHVDMNSANHELAALDYLWDRIVPGGFIILDDYGFAIFQKQTAAHQAFFGAKGVPIAELPTGQGLVIKAAA